MKIAGVLLMVAGVALGLYIGVWWAFIGGIVDVVNAVKAPEVAAFAVALGVAKIVFAGAIGWLGGIVPIVFGVALINSD